MTIRYTSGYAVILGNFVTEYWTDVQRDRGELSLYFSFTETNNVFILERNSGLWQRKRRNSNVMK